MINSKCPTWFVVKWLEKHPKRGEPVEFKHKRRVIDTGVLAKHDELISVLDSQWIYVHTRIRVTGKGGTILIQEGRP